MAAGATMRTLQLTLSDVDRGNYETLELRVAQHPSESLRYMWSRIIAYGLSYADGIRFSKGGLSESDQAPLAVWHPDGRLATWIDVGAPSAERLHKASKAAEMRVKSERRVVPTTALDTARPDGPAGSRIQYR